MKYDEIVRQFKHNIFGTLTTIRSIHDPNKIWFVGKEIQKILEFNHLPSVLRDANLDDNEIFIFKKEVDIDFWNKLIDNLNNKPSALNAQGSVNPLISKHTSVLTLISESGFYKSISL